MRLAIVFAVSTAALAHDPITTKLTWSREISRIVYSRCAPCHRTGGQAFPLLAYRDARPWAKAIAEEVLERRMPPWGAVKGFGDFRNDRSLSQEEMDLIANWVDGGAPEGDPKDLPAQPERAKFPREDTVGSPLSVRGPFTLKRAVLLKGIVPKSAPPDLSMQITAELPDGSIEPLLWLHRYQARFGHPFLLRNPIVLPRGTIIRGVPEASAIVLLVATPTRGPARRNARYSPLRSAETAPTPGTHAPAERSR